VSAPADHYFPVQVGDTVRLKKAHPCGGKEWTVTRIGADIGLACATCGRKVLLTRDDFDRRCVQHTTSMSE
jgi:hypothetical protein